MAFISKVGHLLKQTVSRHINTELSASNPSIYQAIRSMSSSKVFIGGLSYSTDDQSLREAFASYGEVIEARVIMDRETGRSRGFGFVSYTSNEEASSAIQALDGKDLHGRMVRVNYATDRTGGFRSGGYGGSSGGGYGGGYGAGGGYGGGSGGYGGDTYGSGGGSFGGGGGYGGGNYDNGASGGAGTFSSGGGYGGGSSGGDNYVSGTSGVDGGNATGGYGGSTGLAYGDGDQDTSNQGNNTGAEGYHQGAPLEVEVHGQR